MGEGGGEDQGRAFDRQDEVRVEQAGDVAGIGGAERRGNGLLDGGKADDDDGFGVVEGGRGVEAEVEGVFFWGSEGGDVLVLRGVEGGEDMGEVDQRADISGVVATGGEAGGRGGVDEVRRGAGGEGGEESLAVAVVEQGLGAGLGEAVVLLIEGALEAIGVGAEVEGAGEEVGMELDFRGIGVGDLLHGGEVGFDAGLLEAGLGEVLGGSDEDAGAALDGGTEGGEVAAGFWCEEEHGLLGVGGYGDGDAFFADLALPGFDASEPILRGRVGGATEEDGDEEVVDRLGGGEVGMKPDLVAGLEVGDGGNGERDAGTGDVDIDSGAVEIETRLGVGGGEGQQEDEGKGETVTQAVRQRAHMFQFRRSAGTDAGCSRTSAWL